MAAPQNRTVIVLAGQRSVQGKRFRTDADGYDAVWKDEDSVEDFTVDWSRELDGDTITGTPTVTVEFGSVVVDSSTNTTTAVTFILSGDAGARSDVVVEIVTLAGRTYNRTIRAYDRDA